MPAIATIFEHSNYSGRALQLQGVGDYDYATLGSHSFNDLTSSIKIESGYYLQAFTDAGFKGASAISRAAQATWEMVLMTKSHHSGWLGAPRTAPLPLIIRAMAQPIGQRPSLHLPLVQT